MNTSAAMTDALFAGKEANVEQTYQRLLTEIGASGEFSADAKKTSIHIVRTTGFAGVHPRKSYLILNLRLDRELTGPRIFKSEQVSKNRYHNEIKLAAPEEIDAEIVGWLREAYALG